MKIFITLSLLLVSEYSDRNLIRYLTEVSKIVQATTELGISVGTEDVRGNMQAIGDVISQIDTMVNECSKPICLSEAQSRCENSTGKKCEKYGAIMYPKMQSILQTSLILCFRFNFVLIPSESMDCFLLNLKNIQEEMDILGCSVMDSALINLKKRCQKDHKNGSQKTGEICYPKCKRRLPQCWLMCLLSRLSRKYD